MFQTSLQIKDPTSYKHVTDLNVQRSLSLIPDRKSRQCTRLTVRLSVIKFNHPFHLLNRCIGFDWPIESHDQPASDWPKIYGL